MKAGQYFELMENGQHSEYTVYHWARGIYSASGEDNFRGTFMVVLEPKEITFYSYFQEDFKSSSEDKKDMKTHGESKKDSSLGYKTSKHKILSIPYNIRNNTIERITSELSTLLSSEQHISTELEQHIELIDSVQSAQPINESVNIRFFGHARAKTNQRNGVNEAPTLTLGLLFQTFISDFLWDLKVNKCFNYSSHESQVIQLVDKVSLLKGLYLKMHFRELSNFLVGNWDSHKEDWMQRTLNEIAKNWIDFLTDPTQEVLFVGELSNNYFTSIDAEIEFVLNRSKQLEGATIRQNRGEKIINFLLSRYDYFKLFKFFTNPFTNRLIFLFVGIITTWILFELLRFYVLPESMSLPYGEKIPMIIVLFFVIAIFLSLILNGFRFNGMRYIKILIPNIFLPKLVVSIATIWLFFLGTDEVFELFESQSEQFPIKLLLTVTILLSPLLYKELKSVAPSSTRSTIALRIVSLFTIGGIISYSLGIMAWRFSFNKRIASDDKKEFVYKEWKNLSDSKLSRNSNYFYPNTVLRPLDSLNTWIKQSETRLAELQVMSDWFSNLENAYSLKQELNISDSKYNEFETRVFAINIKDSLLPKKPNNEQCSKPENQQEALNALVNDYIKEMKGIDTSLELDYLEDLKKKHHIQTKIWMEILAEKQRIRDNDSLMVKGYNYLKDSLHIMNSFMPHHIDLGLKRLEFALPHGILFRQSLIAMFLGLFIQILIQREPKTNH